MKCHVYSEVRPIDNRLERESERKRKRERERVCVCNPNVCLLVGWLLLVGESVGQVVLISYRITCFLNYRAITSQSLDYFLTRRTQHFSAYDETRKFDTSSLSRNIQITISILIRNPRWGIFCRRRWYWSTTLNQTTYTHIAASFSCLQSILGYKVYISRYTYMYFWNWSVSEFKMKYFSERSDRRPASWLFYWTNGWTDGWTDVRTDIYILHIFQ